MNPKIALFLSLMLVFLLGLGVDLYAPSLPAIAHHFQTTIPSAKITISAYLFGFSLFQLFFGTLSDRYGRKRFLMLGLSVFLIASILAPYAASITQLIIFRFLQGAGASSCSALSKTLQSDHFTGRALTIAANYMTIAWGLGPIVAPFIGGYLQYHFGWHANFYLFSLYSTITLLLVILFMNDKKQIKIVGDFKTIKSHYVTVLTSRTFMCSTLILGFGYSLLIIFNVVGPFLIQTTLGYNAAFFGRIALLVGCAYFSGTITNRLLLKYLLPDTLIKLGLFITAITSIAMLLIAYHLPLSLNTIIIPFFICLYAVGLIFPNCFGKCVNLFPEIGGTAGAILGFGVVLVTSLSSAIVSFLKPGTLIPVAWTFLVLTALQLVTYWIMIRQPFPLKQVRLKL